MASPQTENGYTKIANELLEALAKIRLSGEETQVFLALLRKTYGFQKKTDTISLSQFVEATGINKPNVCRAIKRLIEKNIIIKKDNAGITSYSIQKNYTKWKPLSKKIMLSKKIRGVIKKDNLPLSKKIHTKEKETKETITKERVVIPDWIPTEEFKDFKEMRVKIRKPMTDKAVQLLIGKLGKLKDEGYNPKDVLEQSIEKSWSSVYPLPKKEFDLDKWAKGE
jgi:phage replication O-like protein O